jgi:DNA-directed RNA polymerase subunit RPC12/RpoP
MTLTWQVEHACPQCGAPVSGDEADQLLICPYCRVGYYIHAREAHRYYLPPKNPRHKNLFFVPYWRFKGDVYACRPFKITTHILDAGMPAASLDGVPSSLGLRPQVLKLKFLMPETPGRFLVPDIDFNQALTLMEERVNALGHFGKTETNFAGTYFGEIVSLIYAPYYIDNGILYDGVLDMYLGSTSMTAEDLEHLPVRTAREGAGVEVRFIPAICPHCGWNLEASPESLITVCHHCGVASQSTDTGLSRVAYELIPGNGQEEIYLPFWRIAVQTLGIELTSYADFVRLTNLPRVIRPEWEDLPFFFWTPAFKCHANLFLRLARNVTVAQPKSQAIDHLDGKKMGDAHINLETASESLKISLANICQAKRVLFPKLPEISLTIDQGIMVFIPFESLGRELVDRDLKLSLDRKIVGL